LVLHELGIRDQGRLRPVVFRGSLSPKRWAARSALVGSSSRVIGKRKVGASVCVSLSMATAEAI
ncbi:hypothetical protein ACC811_37500, partial [Rhizobium ruizarguesonis]